ncbi:Non-specific lipid-transfer protein-like protein [Glycine soja]|uniref:Non-specific lipid-transfer protein-like protein n=1 Tax=Glycine soja TaxID=3848 RepID=A0A0B2S1T0_GLYSO|nr:Non-specific lipid-transfer protein-like protein [Glycine soja]
MASKLTLIALVLAVALCAVDLTHSASASSPHAPAPSVDCSNLVLTMADCLSFVTNGSTITKPEGTCCSGLKSVLKTAPACLCEAFKSSAQFGVVLNVTKATSRTNLVLTMADCLSFVTNGSTVTKPEGTCCSGLKSVLKTAPACLCEAFKSSAQFGVVLNVTKATSLPAACKVSAPSATNCGLSETPAAAPAGGLSPQASPSPQQADASTNGPVNEISPAPAPAQGNTASALFPISAGSLLLGILVATFSGF